MDKAPKKMTGANGNALFRGTRVLIGQTGLQGVPGNKNPARTDKNSGRRVVISPVGEYIRQPVKKFEKPPKKIGPCASAPIVAPLKTPENVRPKRHNKRFDHVESHVKLYRQPSQPSHSLSTPVLQECQKMNDRELYAFAKCLKPSKANHKHLPGTTKRDETETEIIHDCYSILDKMSERTRIIAKMVNDFGIPKPNFQSVGSQTIGHFSSTLMAEQVTHFEEPKPNSQSVEIQTVQEFQNLPLLEQFYELHCENTSRNSMLKGLFIAYLLFMFMWLLCQAISCSF